MAAVTVGSRNTRYRAARYGLTQTGLSPVGLHQLWLAPSEIQANGRRLAVTEDHNSRDGTPQEARCVGQKGLLHPPDRPARLGLCGDQGALSLLPNTSQ